MQIINDACKDLRLELGFKPIELKNYVIEDDSMNDKKDTTTEETPKVYGLDDLKEDEKDQYLINAFNYPNIFEIGKIKEENQKLTQEIMNNFSKIDDDECKKKY